MLEIMTYQAADTQALGAKIGLLIKGGMLLRLEGDLGSGKTTFTQGLGKALGVSRAIKSPTYTIVKEYALPQDITLVHIDAYRLEEGGQDTIDLDYYLTAANIVVVEWAQYIEDSLPASYLTLSFTPNESLSERLITITHNEKQPGPYSQLLNQLGKDKGGE